MHTDRRRLRRHRALLVLAASAALLAGYPGPVAEAGTATTSHPSAALPAAALPPPGSYRSVPPARVADTRRNGTRLAAGGRLTIRLADSWGVPATGVGAVQVHVTATGASRASHLTVHPSGVPAPKTSSLNYAVSRSVANSVTVKLGSDGAIGVTNGGGAVHVIVDLVGWFAAAPVDSMNGLHAIVPARKFDSRTTGTRVGRSGTSVTVTGGTVPGAATAVVANLTTVNASASGLPLLSWAAGASRPSTSNGNTVLGSAIATQVLVGVGVAGRVTVATGSGSTDVVLDVVGYLLGDSPPGGMVTAVAPVRLRDTRTTGTPLTSGSRLVVGVTGGAGVPAGAPAAVVTVTSVPGRNAAGTLTVFGHGEPRPSTSDVNARSDVPVAQQIVVALGVDGALEVARTDGNGHVVVDLVAYVTTIPRPTVSAPSAPLLGGGVTGDLGPRATGILLSSLRYGLNTWWRDTAPGLLARPMDSTTQSDQTDPVRRLSMEALAAATALATGTYDPSVVGASRDQAEAMVMTVLDRVACRHRATVVGGWGRSWQSTMWSSIAARAAWLVWASVPAPTRECIRAMAISEADFATTLRPYYLADAAGRQIRPGNTGAEENSWFALAPAVAVAMMPTAEYRDAWRRAQVRLLAASWLAPRHLALNPVVDGVPLAQLVEGTNVLDDGTVVNHHRIAPDYSTNTYQNVDGILVALLAGHQAPQASLVGLAEVYRALGTNTYAVVDGYLEPGGTIYPEGTASVYYPQGCDWGLGQMLPYALLDVQTDLLGLGGPADAPADPRLEAQLHLNAAARMQQRSQDGRMYADPAEYTYVGREEHTAQLASQVVLTLVLTRSGLLPVTSAAITSVRPETLLTPPAAPNETYLMTPR